MLPGPGRELVLLPLNPAAITSGRNFKDAGLTKDEPNGGEVERKPAKTSEERKLGKDRFSENWPKKPEDATMTFKKWSGGHTQWNHLTSKS